MNATVRVALEPELERAVALRRYLPGFSARPSMRPLKRSRLAPRASA